MEEGELEDDDDDEMSGGDGFFDGYSMWRPGYRGAPPGGHGNFFMGSRGRPGDDDEEHLRQLLKKPDFKVTVRVGSHVLSRSLAMLSCLRLGRIHDMKVKLQKDVLWILFLKCLNKG